MQIPAPQLKKLSADWLPWKYQVNVFGDAMKYGSKEHGVVIRSCCNFGNLSSAKSFLKSIQP